jgi:hypothetical protein
MKVFPSRIVLVLALATTPMLQGCIAAFGAIGCGFRSSSNFAKCIDEKYDTSFSKTGPTAPSKKPTKKEKD